ncbi:MAG TPA: hypothetical protein VF128_02440 [Gemmatimonadaceae bacterium]
MERLILKAVGLAVLATIVCSRGAGAPPCGTGCVPLRPSDYGVDGLGSLVTSLDSGAGSVTLLARIELSMSRALLGVLSDLHQGRVDPSTLGVDPPRTGRLDLPAVVVDVSRAGDVAPGN